MGKLKNELNQLKKDFNDFKQAMIKLEYLRETNFKGKITNKKLLEKLCDEYTFKKSLFAGFVFSNVPYSTKIEKCKEFDIESIDKLYNEIKKLEKEQEIFDKLKEVKYETNN